MTRVMKMEWGGLALLGLLLISGCVPQSDDAEAVVVRDSVGIAIIENRTPDWGDDGSWWILPDPILTVGEADGEPEYEFHGVSSVTRLSDGRIAVALASAGVVRLFDCRGRFLQSIGGLGHGPGEFQRAHRLLEGPQGDLWIWDGYRGRMTVFSPGGQYEDSFAVPEGSTWAGGFLQGIDRSGVLYFVLTPPGSVLPSELGRVTREPFKVVRFRPEEETLDTIIDLLGRQYYHYVDEGGAMRGRPIFGRTSTMALRSTSLVTANTDAFELRVYDHAGALRSIIIRTGDPRPVTRGEVRRVRDGLLAAADSVANPTLRRLRLGLASELPARQSLPAFESLRVDSGDHLWVLRSGFSWQEGSTWDVFNPEGRWLGTVELPEELSGMTIHQIDDEMIVGVLFDELDVPYVSLFPLMKDTDASPPVSACPD